MVLPPSSDRRTSASHIDRFTPGKFAFHSILTTCPGVKTCPGLGEISVAMYFHLESCPNAVPGDCKARKNANESRARTNRCVLIFSVHPSQRELSIALLSPTSLHFRNVIRWFWPNGASLRKKQPR